MYKSYKNVNFSGIPFDLTFHSSSTGRYKTHYNLSWTLKSFVPIQKTELQYKNKVSNVLSCMNSILPFDLHNILQSKGQSSNQT